MAELKASPDTIDKNDPELDPEEITISAFDRADNFEPKIYLKQKLSGTRKSFVCYSRWKVYF